MDTRKSIRLLTEARLPSGLVSVGGGGSKHLLVHLLVHVSYSWRRSASLWELSLSANASVCRMCRSDSSESCFTGLLFPYLYTHFLFLTQQS